MKKAVQEEVDLLETEWIDHGIERTPSHLLYDHEIEQKAVDFFRRNRFRIRRDVIKLLEPLPFNHEHLRDNWKDYYYNKTVQIVDGIDREKKIPCIRTRPRPSYKDWYDHYLDDVARVVAEYKTIKYVEPDITKKVAGGALFRYNSGKGIPSSQLRKSTVLKIIWTAKDLFNSKRYPINCSQQCKINILNCDYLTDRHKRQEDCPKNSQMAEEFKKEWKKRSALGYVPEIAYLLAKFGVLNVGECSYRTEDTCGKSPCLTQKLKGCGHTAKGLMRSKIENLHPHLESYLTQYGLSMSVSVPCVNRH